MAIALAAAAGCEETTAPVFDAVPQFAQGDNGVWTVNTLADPGDGVCDDTECTLREAIAAAASGDAIAFAGGLQGVIQLTNGQLAIVDKHLSIDGDGRIEIDAQHNSRVIDIVFDEGPRPDVALAGLVLRNGSASGNGGGIRTEGRTLTLDDVTVSGNESLGHGGGIASSDTDVAIRNSAISNNTASIRGGGIYSFFTELTLTNSTVDDNESGAGGGIYGNVGSIQATGSTISGNRVPDGTGGGIFNEDLTSVTLVRTTVSGNTASHTGGILNLGTLDLRSSTITLNSALLGAGGIGTSGPATAMNSIVAGNTSNGLNTPDECQMFGDVFTTLGYNLTTDFISCDFGASGDRLVGSAQVFTEVLEQQLADNGGPTMTHALIARGHAVDAGYCPGETMDQRGFDRPIDDPIMPNAVDACDIGAYELQGPVGAIADLMISQSVNKTSVKQGELLTYSIRVQNLGPDTAPDVVVDNLLSSGVTFVEARHTKGTHTAPPRGETGTVSWYLGDMLDQDNEVAEIVVTVLVRGKTTITNTATVTADAIDPNDANNSAAITVSVGAGTSKPKK